MKKVGKPLNDLLEELRVSDVCLDVAQALLRCGLVRWDERFVVSYRDSRGTGVSPVHTPPARRTACPSKADCVNVRCHEDGYCRRTGEILQGAMT